MLAALERAVGEDDVVDLIFERDHFTVLTGWVTREEHDHPANSREAEGEVRDPAKIRLACRTVVEVDPGANVFVAGYDGTSWRSACPRNEYGAPPR